jgi:hypothetical protein
MKSGRIAEKVRATCTGLGVLALMLAFLFGIFATVLGALQVWISYCSWKGPSAGWACQTKDIIGNIKIIEVSLV